MKQIGIPPPREGLGDPRIPKWEKSECCNTIKIILNKFVIIVYNLFKIKKLLKTSKIFLIVYPEAEFKELEPREHRF